MGGCEGVEWAWNEDGGGVAVAGTGGGERMVWWIAVVVLLSATRPLLTTCVLEGCRVGPIWAYGEIGMDSSLRRYFRSSGREIAGFWMDLVLLCKGRITRAGEKGRWKRLRRIDLPTLRSSDGSAGHADGGKRGGWAMGLFEGGMIELVVFSLAESIAF